MATLRSLNIDLRANTARLSQDFNKAAGIVGQFQREARESFAGITKSIFSAQAAITALVGAAGFGSLVKSSMASADALATSADKLGVTTQALAGLRHAADLSGASNEQLDTSLRTMLKNISDFERGTGRAAVALKGLGFEQGSLINLRADEQLYRIADAMASMRNATDRAAFAQKIFGDSGVELINVLAEGSAGLKAAAAEAQQLGLAISRVDAAKIEMANDAFTRAQAAIKGAGTTIAVELAPYLQVAAEQFVDLIKKNNGFRDEILRGFEIATKTVGFFADTVRGLEVVWQIAKVAAVGFVAGTLTVLDEINKAAASVSNSLIDLVSRPLLSMLDTLGRVSSTAHGLADELRNAFKFTPSPELSRWAEGMRGALIDAETELHTLAITPMPSAGIEQFFATVRAQAEEGAKAIAAAKENMLGGTTSGGGDPMKLWIESAEQYGQRMYELIREAYPLATQSAEEYAIAIRDQIAASMESVESVRQSLLTDEEQLAESYASRAEIIGNALQQQILSEGQARDMLIAMEQAYQAKVIAIKSGGAIQMSKINTQSLTDQARATASFFSNTLQGAATHSRALFQVFKVAKIAEGVLNMHSAISGAYAVGAKIGGPVLGGLFAATAGVAQLANLAAIQSTSFGGGGGSVGGSSGGAVPTYPANPVTGLPQQTSEQDLRTTQSRTVSVTINTDKSGFVPIEWVRDQLIPSINDALGDGATLRIERLASV